MRFPLSVTGSQHTVTDWSAIRATNIKVCRLLTWAKRLPTDLCWPSDKQVKVWDNTFCCLFTIFLLSLTLNTQQSHHRLLSGQLLCHGFGQRGGWGREREGGREGETFEQLVHLVIPEPATACMSASLLFRGFVCECTSHFDLQRLLPI